MRVAVTGSSGLIGSALLGALEGAGHVAVRVPRLPGDGMIDTDALAGADAVVHLAGAGIGDKRWNDERKRLILESRTIGTDRVARALADAAAAGEGPSVFLSGSAIGFYGDRGDEILTESSSAGTGFLAHICTEWEGAAQPAVDAGIRTAFLRTGIVQSRDGGALAKTLLPFKLGIGGRLGSGEQYWSWISIDDEVRAILHLLTADVEGPVNLTGPEPITNAAYTKALGRALHRPTLVPIPSFGPRLLLGRELADTLLHESQRVIPTVLEHAGFSFRHHTIDECLAAVLADDELAR